MEFFEDGLLLDEAGPIRAFAVDGVGADEGSDDFENAFVREGSLTDASAHSADGAPSACGIRRRAHILWTGLTGCSNPEASGRTDRGTET